MTSRLFCLLLVAVVLLAVPASAPAKVNVTVGVGDQSAKMFADSSWKALGLKRTRYFIRWDAIAHPDALKDAVVFVEAARKAHVKVLMHVSTDDLTPGEGTLPSVGEYKKDVGRLVAVFKPMGVTDWGVWNEANHKTQPTSKNPARAAQFYKAFKPMCGGCKIVALDILDQAGVESYIRRWMKAAGSAGKRAKVIGIHNYSEVNRRIRKGTTKYPGTGRIIKAVRKSNKKAKFWYTETGGVVNFGGSFPCNRSRAASRTKFMFGLAKKYDADIERLYVYNWFGADCDGFDAGLVEKSGQRRPAYAVFKSNLAGFKR